MQIKRFEAKNMTTALKLIKKELGPEAVILSARSLRVENRILGSIKMAGVEVTAAIDTYGMPGASNSAPYAVERPMGDRNVQLTPPKKKIFMHAVQNRIKSLAQRRGPAHSVKDHCMQNDDALADIFQYLLSQGVKRNVATEIVDAVKKEFQANRSDFKEKIILKITALLQEKRNLRMQPVRTQSKPKVLAFIGPTGVGKTTAIAKLAARQAIQRNKKVALITIDSCRIAAAEELRVYGKAIGIPLKTAGTPSALEAAINECGHYDFILIDTPGINAKNPREIDDLNSYLEVIRSVDIHLLLSAGGKEADLLNIIEQLRTVNVHYLMFTKLDESSTYGNLINLLFQTQLPLSFLTTGRQVPDSITAGSVEEIVKYLLSSYLDNSAISISETPHQIHRKNSNNSVGDEFVANKNSELQMDPKDKTG
jgi:flagellar biosynthesis protein FlhF